MLIYRRIGALAPLLLAAALGSACANARFGDGEQEGGSGTRPDAAGGGGDEELPDAGESPPTPDAQPPEPDAAPENLRLTQSDSLDVVGDASVACGDETTLFANSYYRVFDLPALGVSGPFQVEKVTFGIQEVFSGGPGLVASVALHTLDGALQIDNLQELVRVDAVLQEQVPPEPGEVGGRKQEVTIDATVPADSVLVVEVGHDALDEDQLLLVGANQAGETGPTYLRSPECGVGEPTEASTITDEDGQPIVMHWVLVVDGQAQ